MKPFEIEKLAEAVLGQIFVPMEASGRHVHVTVEQARQLFGHSLTPDRPLSQPGQYLAKERVTVAGPKGEFRNVAVLGPERKAAQVEISLTDGRSLGIQPPVRLSGDVKNSPGCALIGPNGRVELPEGVTNVESYAFYSCANLKKINFPKSANGLNLYLQEGAVVEIPPEVQYIPYMGKWKNVTFHVTDGSFALEYAQTFGFDYQVIGEAAQLTLGDVNNDIKIDAKDALLVLRISVGKIAPTEGQTSSADVNKDEDINAKDALEILKYAVGKPSVIAKS